MRSWLTNHAIQNVWAKPNIDCQMVVELPRISSPDLSYLRFSLMGISYTLPTITHPYGVYDLGNFHPEKGELNIGYEEGWVLLTDLINRTGASFFFYNIDGVTYPTSRIYLMRTISDRFIVAVRQEVNLFNLGGQKLYCKLYDHNAKVREDIEYKGVSIYVKDIETPFDTNEVLVRYNNLKNSGGRAILLVNGLRYTNPNTADIKSGDICEVVHDDTVVKVVTFKMSTLPAFDSELDKCKKYLLHPPKGDGFNYIDDIELFIVCGGIGRYYYRHDRAALTQLTHNDYAIATKSVNEYSTLFKEWSDVKIELVIRDSGLNMPMTYNHNRIHELYRLEDDKIINVMCGLNSHLPFWKAANLELSAVNRLRSSEVKNISHKLISDSYGYNAALFYSANTPTKTIVGANGHMVANLPPMLSNDSTNYEYDSEGRLLGWWRHLSGTYTCRRNQCTLVESIPGMGGDKLDIIFDAENYLIDRYTNYRYYLQRLVDGEPTQEYVDVTGTDTYHIDDNYLVRWEYDKVRFRPVILSDRKHLVSIQKIAESQGLIRVGVKHTIDGVGTFNVPFNFATIEVFLNSRPLVYGIDYQLDWPAITVTNKTYLSPGADQEVVIRARVPSSEINPPKTGFIIHGMLSENTQYDIKDDKVIRVVYGGSIHHRDDIVFREDVKVGVKGNYDGLPYSVDSVAISAGNLLEGGYESRRLESLERDKLIEDFMTIHYPNEILDNIQPIERRYPLYSPVMNKIILDHKAGILSLVDDDPDYRISTQQLDRIMKAYGYLLSTDPAYLGYDEWFVVVEPHWGTVDVEVPALLYTLLERINHRYFRSRVALSRYLTIRND